MKIYKLFNEPKIIGVVGDVNEAKSNLLYYLIDDLKKIGKFELYTYGLRKSINGAIEIYSVEELEKVNNSIIILDEVMTLFDLNNRMAKRQIENTLRLIHHNNNILVISFIPENIKKFIAGKINVWFIKKVTLSDFINGSKIKKIITNYKGLELGSSVLNISKSEAIVFNGLHYSKIKIPYLKNMDTKLNNKSIISVNKSVKKNVKESVNKIKFIEMKGGKKLK